MVLIFCMKIKYIKLSVFDILIEVHKWYLFYNKISVFDILIEVHQWYLFYDKLSTDLSLTVSFI